MYILKSLGYTHSYIWHVLVLILEREQFVLKVITEYINPPSYIKQPTPIEVAEMRP